MQVQVPHLVGLVEAERRPVDHHSEAARLVGGKPAGARRLPEHQEGLVVQMAGNLQCRSYLDATGWTRQ